MKYTGGCHCKKVRFEFEAPAKLLLTRCNCSICRMTGFLHLIVDGDNFKLLSDESDLGCYQFNTKTAKHYFCKHCGVKSFYVPRSHPDGYSINANCVDVEEGKQLVGDYQDFDGANWEQAMANTSPENF